MTVLLGIALGLVIAGIIWAVTAAVTLWYCARPKTLRRWDRRQFTEWLNSPYADKREYARKQLEKLDEAS